jgi:hypothetical protein
MTPKNNQTHDKSYLYGGISGVKLGVESFSFGEGIEIRRTFSHLFSSNMMAFSPPGPQGYHPAPWKAAKGGFRYDIEAEIRAPQISSLGESFNGKEIIWLIAALLRLAQFPYLSVPMISNYSYQDIPNLEVEPTLTPFEVERRIFIPPNGEIPTVNEEILTWIASNWEEIGQLLNRDNKFFTAFKAFDSAPIQGRTSSSLLALWGGLEQLFSPSPAELRFRVAALLASYLTQPGEDRITLYRKILKLYSQRSTAAHTSKEIDQEPLIETFVIMRNALIKIIEKKHVPSQEELEAYLFCVQV